MNLGNQSLAVIGFPSKIHIKSSLGIHAVFNIAVGLGVLTNSSTTNLIHSSRNRHLQIKFGTAQIRLVFVMYRPIENCHLGLGDKQIQNWHRIPLLLSITNFF